MFDDKFSKKEWTALNNIANIICTLYGLVHSCSILRSMNIYIQISSVKFLFLLRGSSVYDTRLSTDDYIIRYSVFSVISRSSNIHFECYFKIKVIFVLDIYWGYFE